jgi:hypothetical protein
MGVISTYIKGGLGNILFQISTGYSTSLRDGMDFIVDMTGYHGAHHDINKYKSNLLRNIKFSNSFITSPTINETSFHFNEIPKCVSDTKLSGYFQSENYFKEHRQEIIELLSPTEEILSKIEDLYGKILIQKTCSIHVRRGDYVGLPNHHPVLDIEYYKKAVDIIGQDSVFLIFSDDINWCKSNFDFISNKIFVDNLEDFEELYLMSLCDNNIIANSSFSWWGAWLNNRENKKVMGPKKWFGPSLQINDTKDLLPQTWISID